MGTPKAAPAAAGDPGAGAFDPAWFAIWTRSRHEQVVKRELDQRGIESFLPTVGRWSRWKDRRKRIEWPLFPGYCFARFDPAHRLGVVSCVGVVRIVTLAGTLTPIPDHEIDGIKRLVETELKYDPCPFLHEGMWVEVVHGPLKGVSGRLERKGGHARLVLSVSLIERAVSVEVDAADVKASSPPTPKGRPSV